ncbi:MAG: 4-carboxymuconolactone decarboxylase [Azospirillaceae bacterium]
MADGDHEAPRDDAYSRGMAVRRAVLGDGHVDRSEAAKTDFDAEFQRFITEGAWGSVWARPGLSPRERSLVTMAILAAGRHHEEVAMHARATANTGATPDDLKEVLLHVAVYAGVPAANEAVRVVKKALAEAGRLEPGAPRAGDGEATR